MAFAGTGFAPQIHKRRLPGLQNVQQLGIGLAEKGIESRLRGRWKIKQQLVHEKQIK